MIADAGKKLHDLSHPIKAKNVSPPLRGNKAINIRQFGYRKHSFIVNRSIMKDLSIHV